jgi:catechol 2,3-dioxygenase-like lactoylglutathione lyase family enzyme
VHGLAHHGAGDSAGAHHEWVVDDLDAVIARLQARGAELVGEVERYEDIYRTCYIRGPEGIILELAERIS